MPRFYVDGCFSDQEWDLCTNVVIIRHADNEPYPRLFIACTHSPADHALSFTVRRDEAEGLIEHLRDMLKYTDKNGMTPQGKKFYGEIEDQRQWPQGRASPETEDE